MGPAHVLEPFAAVAEVPIFVWVTARQHVQQALDEENCIVVPFHEPPVRRHTRNVKQQTQTAQPRRSRRYCQRQRKLPSRYQTDVHAGAINGRWMLRDVSTVGPIAFLDTFCHAMQLLHLSRQGDVART